MSHDHIEHEIIEERDGRPSWWVRMILALGGILLLAAALVAWQMQDRLPVQYQSALPFLLMGALLLGGLALIESITAEIWVTVIGGIFVLAAAFIIAGRVNVQIDASNHTAYVVDRFTGQVRICDKSGCQELAGFDKPSVSVQKADNAPAASATMTLAVPVKPAVPAKPVAAPSGPPGTPAH